MTQIDEKALEAAAKHYAEAVDYYQPFHAGLSCISADLIRKGIRAAITAYLSAFPTPAGDVGDAAAKIIYDTWAALPGFVPWVAGGNSDRQIDARRIAKRVIDSAMEAHAAISERSADALTAQAAKLAHMTECFDRQAILRTADAKLIMALNERLDEQAAKLAECERAKQHAELCADTLNRIISEVYAAVSDHWFLDPPDGGDVRLHEGVKRIEDAWKAAEARLAECNEECAHILARLTELGGERDQFKADLSMEIRARASATARAERLEAALRRYGPERCSCGFDAALSGDAEPAPAPKQGGDNAE